MMLRSPGPLLTCFALCLIVGVPVNAQGTRQVVPANLLIPQPPPSAPLSDWTESIVHARVSEKVGDAELRGWDYKAVAAAAPVVLFFNGNGMTVDRADPLYRSLVHAGGELIAYDYRGIGFSSGQPDVLTFRQDALRIYDAVAAAHPGRRVVVFGFSLGTAMASYVAAHRPVAGLILAGTIATAADEFPVYMRAAGFDVGAMDNLSPDEAAVEAFNEVENVSKSRAPLLMLHGESDTLVPISQGRKVFAASPSGRKQFVALPGTGHGATAGTAASLQAVAEFLSTL